MPKKNHVLMSNESKVFEVLEEKHVMKTILYLYRNGPSTKMDIYNGVSANPRMPDKLMAMKTIGLVMRVKPDGKSRAQVLALTEKGQRVGEELEKLIGLI